MLHGVSVGKTSHIFWHLEARCSAVLLQPLKQNSVSTEWTQEVLFECLQVIFVTCTVHSFGSLCNSAGGHSAHSPTSCPILRKVYKRDVVRNYTVLLRLTSKIC